MVVFAGGYDAVKYNDVWLLNLTTYTWTEASINGAKPSARYYHSSTCYNDQMLVFGGEDGTAALNEVWSLRFEGNYGWQKISTGGTKPSGRGDVSSVIYDDKLVVFAGGNNLKTARI